jgi:hypothetical protein
MSQKLKSITIAGQKFNLAGKADLVNGKVPASQLPSYVDDVIEVTNFASLPETGESGKIYVTIDTNKIYRWSGSAFVEIPTTPQKLDEVSIDITGNNIASGSKLDLYKDALGNIYVFIYVKKVSTSVSTAQVPITLPTNYAPTTNFEPFSTINGIQFYTLNSTFNNPQLPVNFFNNTFYIPSVPNFQGTYDEYYSSFIMTKK